MRSYIIDRSYVEVEKEVGLLHSALTGHTETSVPCLFRMRAGPYDITAVTNAFSLVFEPYQDGNSTRVSIPENVDVKYDQQVIDHFRPKRKEEVA